jgi:hypothetical protein
MLIQVNYTNKRFDYVKDIILDKLLAAGKITKFRRNSGWVTVGVDPVRKTKRDYTYQTPNELKKRTL